MQSVIEVKALEKSFKDVKAVDQVSFSVDKGVCFGLLGPNGAGKTTTIEMMEGLVEPQSGDILFFGQKADKQAYQKVGIQFQNTALQDHLTSREAIEMFAAFYDNPVATDRLIELCHLEDFSEQDHRKLSGGQKQRLLLALALVNDPEILFLDEPTTGLDPQARRDFWQLIQRIKKQGKTIVLTTHYMDEAESLCDEIVIMEKGKVIERGAPTALLAKHFFGVLIRLPAQPLPEAMLKNNQLLQNELGIEITTENTQQTLMDLTQAGVSLEGLQVKTANLDDLFLKLTGHGLGGDNV